MRGNIDGVSPEGLVDGWCWDEQDPDGKVDVTILVDNVPSGSAVATLFRDDLLRAGIGDGYHAFSIYVPWSADGTKRSQVFTLCESGSMRQVGAPRAFQNRNVANLDDRLQELEAKGRLLESRVAELSHHVQFGAAPAELFALVGAFFTQLGRDVASGTAPRPFQTLDHAVDARMAAFPALTLAAPPQPAITVLVDASAPLDHLHPCLRALDRADVGRNASVVVLDTGVAEDVALVSTVVRGIRYIRTATDLVAEWNEAAQAATGEIVVMLNGRAVVSADWLTEIRAIFDLNESLGALGGGVVDADGQFRHGGLRLRDDRVLVDAVKGRSPADPDFARLQPMHALTKHAVAFRPAALQAVGGLDRAYGDDVGAAVVDLCLRLRQGGWGVMFQPFAAMTLRPTYAGETWMPLSLTTPSRSGDLLQTRFPVEREPVPPLEVGQAAVVVTGESDWTDAIAGVRHLQQAGYGVTCIALSAVEPSVARDLQRCGAVIVPCQSDADIGDALARAGIDLAFLPDVYAAIRRFGRPLKSIRSIAGLAALRQAVEGRPTLAAAP